MGRDLEARTDESFVLPTALAGLLAGTVLAHADDKYIKWVGYALIAGSVIGGGIAYYLQNKRK